MSAGFVCSALASGCGETGPASPPIVPATSVPCPSPAAAEPVTPTTSWNWEPVNSPSLQVQSVFVDPEDASVLYAGGRFGLYASSDGGGTWRLVLADAAVNGIALAFLPASSCTVFVGSGSQLQRSADRGRTWHLVHAFPDLVRSIHVSRDSRRIYVGPQVDPRFSQSADGIWVSADLGSTWTLSPLPTPSRGLIPWDIAEDAAGVLYAGTEIYDHPQPYRPLYYRSRDSGTAWEEVTGRLPWHVIKTEAHPTRVTVYALTEGGGLYVTEDEGTNWSRRGRTTFSSELLLDPRSPTTLYAGEHTFGGQPGGAYASTDEGNSFHAIGLDGRIVGSLALDGASRRLYAASYQSGLFRATVPSQR